MKSTKTILAVFSAGLFTFSLAYATDWGSYSSKRPAQATTHTETIQGGIDAESLNSKKALVQSKAATSESATVDPTQACSKKDMMTPEQCHAHCGR